MFHVDIYVHVCSELVLALLKNMNILIPVLPSHEHSSFETGVGVISLDNLENPSQQLMA